MPVQGRRWPESSQQVRVKGRHPTWTGRPSITEGTCTRTHARARTKTGTIRHTKSPQCTHILGTWKEIGIPRENPHRHGENVRTPHRKWPLLGRDFFFPHWRYNKTIRNETTFEDLHYVAKIKGRKEGSSRVLNGCWKPTPYYSL